MPERFWPGAAKRSGVLGSLRFQVLSFLTLALLPIGLLGVMQTRNLTREMQGRYELNLLALTERAYSGEQRVISRAFGAAEALSAVIQQISESPDDCERYLANYATMTRQYAFVGFLPPDGVMTCASARGVFDLSGSPRLAETMENPMPRVVRVDDPITSDSTAITVLQPAFRDEALIGYVVLSIPETVLAAQTDDFAARRPLSLVTFNAKGEFLTAEPGLDEALELAAQRHSAGRSRRSAIRDDPGRESRRQDAHLRGRSGDPRRGLCGRLLGAGRGHPWRPILWNAVDPLSGADVAGQPRRRLCGGQPPGAAPRAPAEPQDAALRSRPPAAARRRAAADVARAGGAGRRLHLDGAGADGRRGPDGGRAAREERAAARGLSPGQEQPSDDFVDHEPADAQVGQPRDPGGAEASAGTGARPRQRAPQPLPERRSQQDGCWGPAQGDLRSDLAGRDTAGHRPQGRDPVRTRCTFFPTRPCRWRCWRRNWPPTR